jgi:hypothetical protein
MNYKLSYDEPGQVISGPTCSVCEQGDDDPSLGKIVLVGEYNDGSGRKIFAHEKHPSGALVGARASKEEPENIWEFTTKFKYITAGTGVGTGVNPEEDATIEKTFSTISMPKVKEIQRTQVPEDGNPPDTFGQ